MKRKRTRGYLPTILILTGRLNSTSGEPSISTENEYSPSSVMSNCKSTVRFNMPCISFEPLNTCVVIGPSLSPLGVWIFSNSLCFLSFFTPTIPKISLVEKCTTSGRWGYLLYVLSILGRALTISKGGTFLGITLSQKTAYTYLMSSAIIVALWHKGGTNMPGNQVVINNGIRYYVGDSKMEELLARLDNNGIKQYHQYYTVSDI